jgi:hypothetical protein
MESNCMELLYKLNTVRSRENKLSKEFVASNWVTSCPLRNPPPPRQPPGRVRSPRLQLGRRISYCLLVPRVQYCDFSGRGTFGTGLGLQQELQSQDLGLD